MTQITGVTLLRLVPPTESPVRWSRRSVTSVADGADGSFATRLATMASKTVARSGARTSRSKATSRQRVPTCATSSSPQAGAQARQAAQPVAAGRRRADLRAGHARHLADGGTGHRRRGAVDRAGPRHRARDTAATGSRWCCWALPSSSPPAPGSTPPARSARGSTRCCGRSSARRVLALPVVTAAVAVVLMRTEPNPDARPRLILGASHDRPVGARPAPPVVRFAGRPGIAPSRSGIHRLRHRRAVVGRADAWIAAPLLFIGALFGLLLLTGTTIREVPDALRAMFGTRLCRYARRRGRTTTTATTRRRRCRAKTSPTATTTTARLATTSRRRGRRRDRPPRCSTTRRDESPTVPEPAAREPPSRLPSRTPRSWTGSSRAPTRCRR